MEKEFRWGVERVEMRKKKSLNWALLLNDESQESE